MTVSLQRTSPPAGPRTDRDLGRDIRMLVTAVTDLQEQVNVLEQRVAALENP